MKRMMLCALLASNALVAMDDLNAISTRNENSDEEDETCAFCQIIQKDPPVLRNFFSAQIEVNAPDDVSMVIVEPKREQWRPYIFFTTKLHTSSNIQLKDLHAFAEQVIRARNQVITERTESGTQAHLFVKYYLEKTQGRKVFIDPASVIITDQRYVHSEQNAADPQPPVTSQTSVSSTQPSTNASCTQASCQCIIS